MNKLNAKRSGWICVLTAAVLVVGSCSSVTEPRLPEEDKDPKTPPGEQPAMIQQVNTLPIFV